MTNSGTCIFNIAVSDGTNTSTKQVYLVRYDVNPLPVLGQAGFRIGAPYPFTLRAFDDLHEPTLDKTIIVAAAPGAPVISSASVASAIVGTPFSYTIVASGNLTGFSATNLPPGLTFTNGIISGTPTSVGIYNLQLAATNASGVGHGNLALTVQLPLPVVTSSANADGFTNAPFNYIIQAANLPNSFTATGLPSGVTLNSLSGANHRHEHDRRYF